MFCPDGYTHYHEVRDICSSVAAAMIPYIPGQETVWSDGKIDLSKSRGERRRICEYMIFERFHETTRHSTFACSPSGMLLKLSWWAARPVIYNHFAEYSSEHLLNGGEMLFIDDRTGAIDIEGLDVRLSWCYSAGERPRLDHEARVLRPLDGWGVCFPTPAVPSEADLLKAQQRKEGGTAEVSDAGPGRPKKRVEAAKAFLRAYPTGRGAHSWKEVLGTLAERQGVDVSLDTLKRGLREIGVDAED